MAKKFSIPLIVILLLVATSCSQTPSETVAPAKPTETKSSMTATIQAPSAATATEEQPNISEAAQRILGNGVVRIATYENTFEPFFIKDGENYSGFEVSLAEELVNRLFAGQVSIEWVPTSFPEALSPLAEGRADMEIHHLLVTPDRQSKALFSGAYYLTGEVFVVLAGGEIQTPNDLEGKDVGVFSNPISQAGINEAAVSVGITINPVIIDEYDAAMSALRNNEVAGLWFTWTTLLDEPDLTYLKGPFVGRPIAIGLPLGQDDFKEEVDSVLLEIIADGTWQSLYDEWFPIPMPWNLGEMFAYPVEG